MTAIPGEVLATTTPTSVPTSAAGAEDAAENFLTALLAALGSTPSDGPAQVDGPDAELELAEAVDQMLVPTLGETPAQVAPTHIAQGDAFRGSVLGAAPSETAEPAAAIDPILAAGVAGQFPIISSRETNADQPNPALALSEKLAVTGPAGAAPGSPVAPSTAAAELAETPAVPPDRVANGERAAVSTTHPANDPGSEQSAAPATHQATTTGSGQSADRDDRQDSNPAASHRLALAPEQSTVPAEPAASSPSPAAAATASSAAATTPVASTAAAGAPASPPVANTAALDRVAAQVFGEVTGLVSRGNGTHRITMTLNPEQLGEVRVVMTMRDGAVHVQMAAGHEARAALLDGSPELSRLLESSGATETRIVVRDLPAGSPTTPTAHPSSTLLGGDGSPDQHAGTRADHQARDGSDHTTSRPVRAEGTTPGSVPKSIQPVIETRTAGVDLTM